MFYWCEISHCLRDLANRIPRSFDLKKHILVIDDEMIVTQVLAQLLTRSSYKVTIALNGQQGIELFRADPTDLAIVDVFMPEVDGIEVIRTLKAENP